MNVNGWTLKAHPAFSEYFKKLIVTVEQLEKSNPETYQSHPSTKLLNIIKELVYNHIPRDPTAKEFRQGKKLGADRKHWFRAKFFQRFRLFFPYSSTDKIIIYAWVNDEKTLRKEGSKTDPYQKFTKMLDQGNPPNSWSELLKASFDIDNLNKEDLNIETISEDSETLI